MVNRIALITGVLGQDGSYLAQLLLHKGYQLIGTKRTTSDLSNHNYLGITKQVEYVDCDLQNETAIQDVISHYKPDELYHLGGLSAPGQSWSDPKAYTETNALGMLYLLNAIKMHSPKTKLVNAATSEMFGAQHQGGLQTEETPFQPTNPYAVTKIYAYWMGQIYKKSYNLFVANAILFSHESPLRGPQFVTRKISMGVAKIKLGLTDHIVLGNIESKRDWGFAGDYVEAMWRIAQQTEPDDFVLSTGAVHTIREYLDIAFQYIGIQDWTSYVQTDPTLYRPIDLPNLSGASEKAQRVLGWKPQVDFKALVELMVQADLGRLSG
ncbi:MAG: GDP-mannose 4,6-dehydratase [Patescibacteria group bacterium]